MKLPAIVFSLWIYAAWFGCVLFAKRGWELESLVFPILTWILFWYIYRPNRQEITKLIVLCAIGLAFDSTMYSLGGIRYLYSPAVGIPIWMVALWFTFVPSLHQLSRALNKRFALAAILGGIFGPLSYRAGAAFDILYLQGSFVVGVYALFWGLFLSYGTFWLLQKDVQHANS